MILKEKSESDQLAANQIQPSKEEATDDLDKTKKPETEQVQTSEEESSTDSKEKKVTPEVTDVQEKASSEPSSAVKEESKSDSSSEYISNPALSITITNRSKQEGSENEAPDTESIDATTNVDSEVEAAPKKHIIDVLFDFVRTDSELNPVL